MNLLPVPRSLDLTGDAVPNRPARKRTDPSLPTQGYVLRIDDSGVDLAAADAAGTFYGEATLAQLARLHGDALPAGTVRDHPDLEVRGVMLDVSRDKVPTMPTLRAMIARLATWKINQVQLYTEHTFAYRDHPDVHRAASPFTAEEILELDAFCTDHHVELVPNQNCLGHMNRWLAHERYRPLAIAPDGFVDPFGISRAPMTVDPTNPGSIDLVRDLLAELLPLFTSRRVHVGLDEAWELPRERIDDFIDWVSACAPSPSWTGGRCSCGATWWPASPTVAGPLPPGVTVCEWGYDDWHPFDQPLCRVGRGRRPVLGGARDLELAEHPRPADERPHQLPRTRRRPPSPTGRPDSSSPTGGTRGTSSSRSSASRRWPTARRCPGAWRPTPTWT